LVKRLLGSRQTTSGIDSLRCPGLVSSALPPHTPLYVLGVQSGPAAAPNGHEGDYAPHTVTPVTSRHDQRGPPSIAHMASDRDLDPLWQDLDWYVSNVVDPLVLLTPLVFCNWFCVLCVVCCAPCVVVLC